MIMPFRLDALTNKTRQEVVALSAITGCLLGAMCLMVLPDFRSLFLYPDGLFYWAYYLVSFGAFFAVAGGCGTSQRGLDRPDPEMETKRGGAARPARTVSST